MSKKPELTTREILKITGKLTEKNYQLIADVMDAIGKLKETESELKDAKELYEKPFSCIIKKNPKTFLICITIILIILTIATCFFFNGKSLSYSNKDNGVETKLNIKK